MKERLLDNEIKEMFKDDGTSVPDIVSDRIDKTLNSLDKAEKLEDKRENSMYKRVKKGAIAAGLMGAMIVGIGVPSYAYMNNIPLKQAMLDFFKFDDEYNKVITDYGIAKESNGIKLTIDSLIFDGYGLLVNYTVESKEALIVADNIIQNEDMFGIIYKEDLLKEGGGPMPQLQSQFGEFMDDEKKVYSGGLLFNIDGSAFDSLANTDIKDSESNVDLSKVPDKYKFNLEINSIANIDGKWAYEMDVKSEKAKGNVKEIVINEDLSYMGKGAKINNIVITPIRLYLNADKSDDGIMHDFIIVDNEGKMLENIRSSVNSNGVAANYIGEFNAIGMNTESLKIIPYKYDKENKSEGVHLNLDRETKLDTGAGRELTITRVYEKDGNTYVHYIPETYINDMIPFHLIDSEGVEHYQYIKYYQESEASKPFGEERYLLFEGELLNKDLKVATYTTIYFDDAFTVDIN